MARLHAPFAPDDPSEIGAPLCLPWTVHAAMLVHHEPAVTCGRCKKKLAKQRVERRPVELEEAFRDLAHVLAGPPVVRYPSLTRDVMHNAHCLRGMDPCHCELCGIDRHNVKAKAEWEADAQLRPHRVHEYDFGSSRAALEMLLRWRQDGPAARSSQGSIQSRAQETARLGAQVQTTQRYDRDSLEIRRAILATDVERACFRAFAEAQACRGLEDHHCVTILLDSVDATGRGVEWWAECTGLSESAIKGLISHGMRMAQRYLFEAELIPRPRARRGALLARVA